jgi:DMSO/TMAO reductase YedYZ molybdopterin-dependent catalytic subunit
MTVVAAPPERPPAPTGGGTAPWAAAAGAVAAAVSLGTAELLAAMTQTVPSPVVAVGEAVIDLVPGDVARTGIEVFGANDKAALVIGIVLVSCLAGTWLGRFAVRWGSGAGAAVLALFGVVGVLAARRVPETSTPAAVVVTAGAVLAGWGALHTLLRQVPSAAGGGAPRLGERTPSVASARRSFLLAGGAFLATAAASAALGRAVAGRAVDVAARVAVRLPRPRRPLAPPPPAATLPVPGLSTLVTPNDRFYRIDTELVVPRYDSAGWNMAVTGMVDRPFHLSFDEVLALPMVEEYVTLSCVSNEVGGDLVGNAAWLGVPLADLLERAGVRDGADQVIGRSRDGFTAGFPLEAALDGRTAMVAVGMNGEPLPYAHGFPLRLVVAGLYGYVSATKWLTQIEVTTFDEKQGYWVPRGWSARAPVKTQSRIDVPSHGDDLPAGTVTVAGVAWAPTRGIDAVEVQVDDGPWREAELSEPLSASTWRQWRLRWDAKPGRHLLRVRATDGDGETQTGEQHRPPPDGATGWHTIRVDVSE